jgi:hypothetical protein
MKKGFQNPFALNAAQKFGLSPDPSMLRGSTRVRMQRADARIRRPGTAEARDAGSAMRTYGHTQPGSSLTGNPGHGVTAGNRARTSQDTAQGTSGKGSRTRHGNTQSKTASQYAGSLELLFSEDDLLRGLIMLEVLGRPKCFRRGGGGF